MREQELLRNVLMQQNVEIYVYEKNVEKQKFMDSFSKYWIYT